MPGQRHFLEPHPDDAEGRPRLLVIASELKLRAMRGDIEAWERLKYMIVADSPRVV